MMDGKTILIIGIVVIIILISLPTIINAGITLVKGLTYTAPAVNQAVKQICNIDSTILDSVVNSVQKQNPIDQRIQNIINMYKSGSKLTECDVVKLVSYLDENEKKRLNVQDMVCTAVNCLGN